MTINRQNNGCNEILREKQKEIAGRQPTVNEMHLLSYRIVISRQATSLSGTGRPTGACMYICMYVG